MKKETINSAMPCCGHCRHWCAPVANERIDNGTCMYPVPDWMSRYFNTKRETHYFDGQTCQTWGFKT